MVLISPYTFTTFWILLALVLYAVMGVVAAVGYSPALRGQIRALDEGGAGSEEFRRYSKRATALGIPLAVLALAILGLMVFKPTL
jgi:uncharacterized membrane protein